MVPNLSTSILFDIACQNPKSNVLQGCIIECEKNIFFLFLHVNAEIRKKCFFSIRP